jgi:16S rRNA (guanine527-N7)-methyltransferase
VFHVKHEADALAAILGADPTKDELERLSSFERLLLKRAVPLGFVAQADAVEMWTRHILDSARAAPFVPAGAVADLGSGVGLPGIVVAILRSDVVVHLVEVQQRRLALLELLTEALALSNAVPIGARVEDLGGTYVGALARAFADPVRSWRLAEPHLGSGGELVYFGGRTFDRTSLDALGVRVRTVPPPRSLASSGPLVIMSRQ